MSTISDTIHVDSYSPISNRAAVGWEVNGILYHVWISVFRSGTWDGDDIIYKNPPLHLKYGEEGYFHTRQLDRTKKVNQELWRDIEAYVNANDLVCKAILAHGVKLAEERAEAAETQRIHTIKEAGVEMYEAAKLARDLLASPEGPQELGRIFAALSDAIAKAEGRS